MADSKRPVLQQGLDPDEFDRWYWTVAELRDFLRSVGVSGAGTKVVLSERVRCVLAGSEVPPVRNAGKVRLTPPFDRSTRLHGGVVLSRELRDWFDAEAGGGFRANGVVRGLLADPDGATLGDVIDAYVASVGQVGGAIGAQFEWNRFVSEWSKHNPAGGAAEMRAAWKEHKGTRRQ